MTTHHEDEDQHIALIPWNFSKRDTLATALGLVAAGASWAIAQWLGMQTTLLPVAVQFVVTAIFLGFTEED